MLQWRLVLMWNVCRVHIFVCVLWNDCSGWETQEELTAAIMHQISSPFTLQRSWADTCWKGDTAACAGILVIYETTSNLLSFMWAVGTFFPAEKLWLWNSWEWNRTRETTGHCHCVWRKSASKSCQHGKWVPKITGFWECSVLTIMI